MGGALPWLRGAAGGRGPQRPRVVTEVRRRRPRAAEAEGRRRGVPPEAGGLEDNDEDDRIGRKIARRVCSGKKAIEGKEIATRITSGGGWRVSWMWVFTALASNLASQVYFPNLLELLLVGSWSPLARP